MATPFETLLKGVEDYGKTTIELLKLKAAKKTAEIVSSMASSVAILFVVAMFFVSFTTGIALLIGEWLGKASYGFLVIAAFYMLLAVLFYAFRNQLFKKPISNRIIKMLFQ